VQSGNHTKVQLDASLPMHALPDPTSFTLDVCLIGAQGQVHDILRKSTLKKDDVDSLHKAMREDMSQVSRFAPDFFLKKLFENFSSLAMWDLSMTNAPYPFFPNSFLFLVSKSGRVIKDLSMFVLTDKCLVPLCASSLNRVRRSGRRIAWRCQLCITFHCLQATRDVMEYSKQGKKK